MERRASSQRTPRPEPERAGPVSGVEDLMAALQASVELPPNGSRFLSLGGLFRDVAGFLDRQPGVLYFGNNRQPAMYYYFVQNARLGTWRVQHL